MIHVIPCPLVDVLVHLLAHARASVRVRCVVCVNLCVYVHGSDSEFPVHTVKPLTRQRRDRALYITADRLVY